MTLNKNREMILARNRQGWRNLIERWHSQEMIDRFFECRFIISPGRAGDNKIRSMHPLTRYVMGQIMSYVSRLYDEAYSFDHIERYCYGEAAQRLWPWSDDFHDKDFEPNSKNKEWLEFIHRLPKTIRWTDASGGMMIRPLSLPGATAVMDFLESEEFVKMLMDMSGPFGRFNKTSPLRLPREYIK